MSSFANYWIITKTSSRREHGTGIHGCAKLEIRLASLARTKWIRAIIQTSTTIKVLAPTLVFALFSKCKTRHFSILCLKSRRMASFELVEYFKKRREGVKRLTKALSLCCRVSGKCI